MAKFEKLMSFIKGISLVLVLTSVSEVFSDYQTVKDAHTLLINAIAQMEGSDTFFKGVMDLAIVVSTEEVVDSVKNNRNATPQVRSLKLIDAIANACSKIYRKVLKKEVEFTSVELEQMSDLIYKIGSFWPYEYLIQKKNFFRWAEEIFQKVRSQPELPLPEAPAKVVEQKSANLQVQKKEEPKPEVLEFFTRIKTPRLKASSRGFGQGSSRHKGDSDALLAGNKNEAEKSGKRPSRKTRQTVCTLCSSQLEPGCSKQVTGNKENLAASGSKSKIKRSSNGSALNPQAQNLQNSALPAWAQGRKSEERLFFDDGPVKQRPFNKKIALGAASRQKETDPDELARKAPSTTQAQVSQSENQSGNSTRR